VLSQGIIKRNVVDFMVKALPEQCVFLIKIRLPEFISILMHINAITFILADPTHNHFFTRSIMFNLKSK
jgi:hypothetical protein